jgi:putative PEP-CTERM system TPR-repeat lipoprotein
VPAQYLQALLQARAKDYAAADTTLTKYQTAFGSFPRGYYLLAVVKLQEKQFEQAQAAITSYLASVPDDTGGQRVEAEIMLRKGDAAHAADVLEKVTADMPDDPQSLAMLGEAYMQLGRGQQAIDAFDRASKLAPDNVAVLRGLALNRLAVGDNAEGTSELERALKLAPTDSTTGIALVLDYIRQRKFDEAAKLVADFRQSDPNNAVIANLSGRVEFARGKLSAAEADYTAVEKQFPDYAPARLQLGAIYMAEGEPAKARGEFESVLAKDPLSLPALQNISAIDINEQHLDEALDLWQKAHRREPDNVGVTIGLIQVLIAKKDFDGGLSIIRDMQVRLPNEPRLYAMRAELELQKNTPGPAVVSLQRLTDLAPQDPAAKRDLAIAEEKSGDLSAAIATIGESRKLDPSNIGLAAEQVRLLGERSPDDGIAAAQRLAQEMPDQPMAQALEGDYLVSLKRPGDAMSAYQRAMQAHPSLTLAERIAAAEVRDGKQPAAAKTLADWAAAHPTDVASKFAVANFALTQKDWAAAKDDYEALAKEQPDNPLILNNLAVIYQRQNDMAKAAEYAQKAHDALPLNASITDTLGWVLFNKDKSPAALKYLQEAHMASPNDLDIQYHLAYALDATGDKAGATDLLKKAVAAGRDFDNKKDAQALLDKIGKG